MDWKAHTLEVWFYLYWLSMNEKKEKKRKVEKVGMLPPLYGERKEEEISL